MPVTTPKFRGAISGRHLGRKPAPPERREQVLPLRNFVKLEKRPVPETDDYAAKAQDALTKMMDNDHEGCCVATTAAKMLGIQNAYRPGGSVVVATDAEVSRFYHAVGGPGDNGLYIPDALEYLSTKGMKIGPKTHTIDGFAILDASDDALFDAACHWFGGVHLGVNLTHRQYQHAEDSDVWDLDGTEVIGGHSIPVTRRGGDKLTIATWARQPQITRRLLRSRAWCDEAYVVMGPDWFRDGIDTNAVNVEALRNALQAIKNGGTPDIPDDPNPPPPPPPPPTPDVGRWEGKGTLHVGGIELPLDVAGQFAGGIPGARGANPWAVLGDLAKLIADWKRKDWVGVAADVQQLLTDLGISMSPEDRAAFAQAFFEEMERAERTGEKHRPRN